MTEPRWVLLVCDRCGAPMVPPGEAIAEVPRTTNQARRVARRMGWAFDGRRDLCGDCLPMARGVTR